MSESYDCAVCGERSDRMKRATINPQKESVEVKLMRQCGLVVLAVCALGAIAASSASAAQFVGTFPTTFTATSPEGKLETAAGLAIICTKDKASGEITGAKTGTTTVDFEGCKEGKVGCRSEKVNAKKETEKDAAEVILLDNQKLVPVDTSVGTKGGTAFTLTEPLKILCGTAKDTVENSVIGEVGTVGAKSTKNKLTFAGAKGVQTTVDVTNCTEEKAFCEGLKHLKAKLGAAAEEASLAGTEELTFAKEVEFKL